MNHRVFYLLTALVIIVTACLLSTGCKKIIFEDMSQCDQGVDFTFYEVSPDDYTKKLYPEAVKEVRIFAFDEQGRLVREISQKGLKLSKDYYLRTDYYHVGTSNFFVWAGSDLSQLDFSQFEPGKTTREEMIVALKRQADSFKGAIAPIYVGEPENGPLTQEDRSHKGTFYDKVPIRLKQLNNRLNFTLLGLNPHRDYTIQVEDDNGRYTIEGKIDKDGRFVYNPSDLKMEKKEETAKITAWIDVMKLEKGRNARLIITDTTKGRKIFDENLVEGVILKPGPGGIPSTNNLDKQHVFDIRLQFEEDQEKDTYIVVAGIVNQWNIVFRIEELK